MPYKVNQERRHRIPKARYRVKNWRDYDAALCRRGDLTVWVTAEALDAWTPANTGRRGRPRRYSEMVVETGLMLRLAFGRPWRQTEGMLASILRLLDVNLPVPDHTTCCCKRPAVSRPTRQPLSQRTPEIQRRE